MNKALMVELYEGAKVVERNLGIPALFQVAQAIQESGWDITPLIINGINSYNIYGIKYHRGDGKSITTSGWDAATYQAYSSYEDCFNDHATLLTLDIGLPISYKQALTQYKKDGNLDLYVARVASVYATDKNYAIKVLCIMEDLKKILEVKEVVLNKYQEELKNSRITMQRLGIITDFSQKEVDVDRLAVILNRLITKIKNT